MRVLTAVLILLVQYLTVSLGAYSRLGGYGLNAGEAEETQEEQLIKADMITDGGFSLMGASLRDSDLPDSASVVITPDDMGESLVILGSTSQPACCSPDFIFLIDITDYIGFSRQNIEKQIRQFIIETINRATTLPCNEVRIAVVEYGSMARVKFDFAKYPSVGAVKTALEKYKPGSSLGDTSNAASGFAAVADLLENMKRGRRISNTATVFWLLKSNPTDLPQLTTYINSMIKQKAYLSIIAVGDRINYGEVKILATSPAYAFSVDAIDAIVEKCYSFNFDYCPEKRTTTSTTTTTTTTTKPATTQPNPTTPKPTTTTTKKTTTTKTTTTKKPTTQPNPTTPKPTTTTTKKPTTTKTTTTKKPYPTTTKPTTTPQPDPGNPNEFCFGCRSRRNHKDLYADPDNCHKYFQCFYFNETYATGISRVCQNGTFWHDEVLQCMPEDPATPCQDRCRDDAIAAIGYYAGTGCRQFFICSNTASYGMCCPLGSAFNPVTLHCDPSDTCRDTCVQQVPLSPTTVAPPSMYNATVCRDSFGVYISTVAGQPNAFILVTQNGEPSSLQYCPAGFSFSMIDCQCSIESGVTVPPPSVQRRAILWAPFDDDVQDHSVNKFALFKYDGITLDKTVKAQGSGSIFVQNGHISIPGLKTYDMRNSGSWCAFFRCETGPSNNPFGCGASGGILSNNKNDQSTEFTVILGVTAANTLTGRFNFWHPVGSKSVNSPLNSNGWTHVCATYDGLALRLFVNNAISDTEFVGGFFSIAHCPYVIGTDQAFGDFTGHIDDVLITPFAMTRDEIEAHRTGNRAYLVSQGFW